MKRVAIIVGIVAAIVVVGLVGFEIGRQNNLWGVPDRLRTIRAESMASTDLLGLKLIKAEQSGANSPTTKTTLPYVSRIFETDGDVKATKARIITAAEADGWVNIPEMTLDDYWQAKKKIGDFELIMSIRTDSATNKHIELRIS